MLIVTNFARARRVSVLLAAPSCSSRAGGSNARIENTQDVTHKTYQARSVSAGVRRGCRSLVRDTGRRRGHGHDGLADVSALAASHSARSHDGALRPNSLERLTLLLLREWSFAVRGVLGGGTEMIDVDYGSTQAKAARNLRSLRERPVSRQRNKQAPIQ
jgi:hypothetical protein